MRLKKFDCSISDGNAGKRLDIFLKENLTGYSRNRIKKVIDSGGAYVNKRRTLIASHSLNTGDHIEFYDASNDEKRTLKKSDIIYEDKYMIAVNKPANVPTQATYSSIKGTLLELVADYLGAGGKKRYVRLVHRLDKGTTGVIILSKTPGANKALSGQFSDKSIKKEYLALVTGTPENKAGTIETNITRAKGSRVKYENVSEGGKQAISDYEVVKELRGHALISVTPRTGRTHQIRLHMSHIGHPILGDALYGGETRLVLKDDGDITDINIERAMLHAYTITVEHPVHKKKLNLKARLPKDLSDIIGLLT